VVLFAVFAVLRRLAMPGAGEDVRQRVPPTFIFLSAIVNQPCRTLWHIFLRHMSHKSPIIMLVDADEANRFITHKLLKSAGFSGYIVHFTNVDDALDFLCVADPPDMLIIEFSYHEQDKFRILQALEAIEGNTTETVVLWDHPHEWYVQQLSVLFPIKAYYRKPLKIEEALEVVEGME
jgi:CheY-like chemotaxis protein